MTCNQEGGQSHGIARDELVQNDGYLQSDEVLNEVSNVQRYGSSHLRGAVGGGQLLDGNRKGQLNGVASSQLNDENSESQLDDEERNERAHDAHSRIAYYAQGNQQVQVLHKPKAPNVPHGDGMGHEVNERSHDSHQRSHRSLAVGDTCDLDGGMSGPYSHACSQHGQLPQHQLSQALLRIKISF